MSLLRAQGKDQRVWGHSNRKESADGAGFEVYTVQMEQQSLREVHHAKHSSSWWKYSPTTGLLLLGSIKDNWVQVLQITDHLKGPRQGCMEQLRASIKARSFLCMLCFSFTHPIFNKPLLKKVSCVCIRLCRLLCRRYCTVPPVS